MLADTINHSSNIGRLSKDLHLPATSRFELIEFIAYELPRWRDRSDRKQTASETSLTSQLCAHLNSAARRSGGWDFLQFRVEEQDERHQGRKIDLVPAPCDATVWIEGRRHLDFDPILPIECKRLPIPSEKNRDEREYLFSQYSSTGGIQRFKAGVHGGKHCVGAMIAYVQQETSAVWNARIAHWIKELIEAGQTGWSVDDLIQFQYEHKELKLTILRSIHVRQELPRIELRHLWIRMN